jgi:hypothetical protein
MADRALQIESLLVGFSDAAGLPYSNGTLTVYDEGTTNLATIYSQSDKGVEASNPITLDTYGAVANPVFADGNVKLVLKDAAGSTIKTFDEISYSLGNLQVEHETDGTHSAGIIANVEVGAAAAIDMSKIANLTDEHNTAGTHKDIKLGDGGLFGKLQTTTTTVFLASNCYWSGTEWVAYDNTKDASVMTHIENGGVYARLKLDTSSNWVDGTWDYTFKVLDDSGDTTIPGKLIGEPVAFSVYKSADQTLSTNTYTKITFETEEFDTNSDFASNKFTPTVAGKYLLIASLGFANMTDTKGAFTIIYKNGVRYKETSTTATLTGEEVVGNVSIVVDANGSTDYFEVYGFHNEGSNIDVLDTTYWTFFMGHLIALSST